MRFSHEKNQFSKRRYLQRSYRNRVKRKKKEEKKGGGGGKERKKEKKREEKSLN